MNFDIAKIQLNYYLRIVIFAAFAYKRYFEENDYYQQKIFKFVEKRTLNGTSIEISVKRQSNPSVSEMRDLTIDHIVFNKESKKLVEISFVINKNALHRKDILIDLNNEEKYELFIYG